MRAEPIAVVARPRRFEPSTTTSLAQNPASPMVLQGLMQILADLNRKVDALATRPVQQVTVSPVQARPKALPEPEVKEDTAVEPPPTRKRQIDRSRLLDFFD